MSVSGVTSSTAVLQVSQSSPAIPATDTKSVEEENKQVNAQTNRLRNADNDDKSTPSSAEARSSNAVQDSLLTLQESQ
jgi:hypothetical protein